MNLLEARDKVRLRIQDTQKPYLCSDDEIDSNINESEREACARALLIEDDTSYITKVNITPDESQYAISPLIIDVLYITADSNPSCKLTGWTLREGLLILNRAPNADDILTMHCYRLPLRDMEDDDDQPEIRSMHHDRMLDWAISLCYLKPDADMFDQAASDRHAARFAQSFGEKPSAKSFRNYRDKTLRAVQFNGEM